MIRLYNSCLIQLNPRSEFLSYYNILCLLMSKFLYNDLNYKKTRIIEFSVFLCYLFDGSKKVCDNILIGLYDIFLLKSNPRIKFFSYHHFFLH